MSVNVSTSFNWPAAILLLSLIATVLFAPWLSVKLLATAGVTAILSTTGVAVLIANSLR